MSKLQIVNETWTVSSFSLFNTVKAKYVAEAGTQPVWDEDGKPIASLFYTYYRKKSKKDSKENPNHRPIIISFNGGPGSGSLWMHVGYTGPKVLKIDKEGFPTQPYGVKDNPYSILDTADIVFVCPVNTGYSRMIFDEKGKFNFSVTGRPSMSALKAIKGPGF